MLDRKHHRALPEFPQILTGVCREGDTDVCKELYVQGIDTAQNSISSKVTAGQNLRASQQDFEEDNKNGH